MYRHLTKVRLLGGCGCVTGRTQETKADGQGGKKINDVRNRCNCRFSNAALRWGRGLRPTCERFETNTVYIAMYARFPPETYSAQGHGLGTGVLAGCNDVYVLHVHCVYGAAQDSRLLSASLPPPPLTHLTKTRALPGGGD